MTFSAIALCILPLALTAAELAPRPAGGGPGGQGGPGRLMMSFEVESVVVKADDAESMAKWAELAAAGYRLAGSAAKSDGSTILFLERMNPAGTVQLPAVVAANPAIAAAVQTRIQEKQRERHPVSASTLPAPTPAAPAEVRTTTPDPVK